MGGQACVFYGAAQVSKDIDVLLLADQANFTRLNAALAELHASRIAVPPFDPAALDRGHAVHFRCQSPDVVGLRVDIMTRLREVPAFAVLWERRTTFVDDSGVEYDLLCIPDLVQAKKTQRNRDWPVVELLVTIHYRENVAAARPPHVEFWLREARTPELLAELCHLFPVPADDLQSKRPLLRLARDQRFDELRTALDVEVREEQARDRAYWEPLRQELEVFRREHRNESE